MKMIGAIVDRQLIKLAVHRNLAVGDSVGETAGSLSGTGTVGKIRLRVVIAKNYVEFLAVGLRNFHRNDTGAYRREYNLHSMVVGDCHPADFSFRRRKCFLFEFHR